MKRRKIVVTYHYKVYLSYHFFLLPLPYFIILQPKIKAKRNSVFER